MTEVFKIPTATVRTRNLASLRHTVNPPGPVPTQAKLNQFMAPAPKVKIAASSKQKCIDELKELQSLQRQYRTSATRQIGGVQAGVRSSVRINKMLRGSPYQLKKDSSNVILVSNSKATTATSSVVPVTRKRQPPSKTGKWAFVVLCR